jgi:plasmid stability protein
MEIHVGDLLIRNVPEELRDALKARASAHKRSLSDEARVLLNAAIVAGEHNAMRPSPNAAEAFREFGIEMGQSADEEAEWLKILEDARKAPDRLVADFE